MAEFAQATTLSSPCLSGIDSSKHSRECWCKHCQRNGIGAFADLRSACKTPAGSRSRRHSRTRRRYTDQSKLLHDARNHLSTVVASCEVMERQLVKVLGSRLPDGPLQRSLSVIRSDAKQLERVIGVLGRQLGGEP